ncbi:MAG: ABC transporter ATP-binding protein [Hominimerdicola sp.]
MIIRASGLSKQYGKLPALNNINLELQRGRIIGLLGPNGSGKTTFIKLVCGLLKPTMGMITVNDIPIGVETKKLISYLPDRNFIPDYMKVKDIMSFFGDFYGDFNYQKAAEMLARLGIDMNACFKNMSKGTKEKVQLAMVMSREAQVYLLDEPIAGVDPAARDFILNTIVSNYNKNAAVIISTHLITDIEPILDDVVMIQNGTLRLHMSVEEIHQQTGQSVDQFFREVYRC